MSQTIPQKQKAKSARIDFRLPPEVKELIEKAAACKGQSLSEYAVSTLVENAREIVREHHVTVLTDRDRDRFLELLDRQSKPNAALLAAARSYRKQLVE